MITESVKMGNGIYRSIDKSFFYAIVSVLNWLADGSYVQMLSYQSVLLALYPAVMYLIGKELHGRLTGLFLATIAIMQEINAIHLMDEFPLVSTKVLLSEPYMQLWTALIVLSLIIALKKNAIGISKPIIVSGGVLGLSTLFRLNTFLAIPFILVIFLLQYGKKRGLLIRSSLLFLLGIFIALAPWMTHNAVKYDDPIRFIKGKFWVINRRFRKTSNLDMDGSFETITFFPEQLISTINRDYQSAEYSSSNSDQFDLENNHLTGTDSTVNGYLHPKYLMASSFLAHINDFKTGKYSQEFFNEVGGIIKSILRHFLNNLVTSF